MTVKGRILTNFNTEYENWPNFDALRQAAFDQEGEDGQIAEGFIVEYTNGLRDFYFFGLPFQDIKEARKFVDEYLPATVAASAHSHLDFFERKGWPVLIDRNARIEIMGPNVTVYDYETGTRVLRAAPESEAPPPPSPNGPF